MTIRIVASGDQHTGARHMTTLEEQGRALRELMAAAAEADVLLLAGDSTHHARPDPDALALWGDALRQLEDRDVEVVAIAGNHEGEAVTRVIGQFRGHVHVATTPQVIRLGGPSRALDVACLPWLVDAHVRAAAAGAKTKEEVAHVLTEAAREILRGLAARRHPDVPLVLLTHATIAGAETSTGWSMGHAPTTGYVLPLEELAAFDFVFAGHLHRHQKLADNVAYTGSLLPLDFSETEPKGFIRAVWDGVLPGMGWQHVPVTAPTVSTWEWDDAKVRQQCSMPAVFNGPAVDLLRVRISCSEATAREFPASLVSAQLYRAGARLVQVEYDITREDRRRDAGMTADLDVSRAMSRHLADHYPDEAQATRLERQAQAAVGELTSSPEWGGGDLAIRALEAHDFLGLADARIELAPEDRLVALCGQVGVGKSSIGADVPRFALFGACRAGDKVRAEIVRAGAELATAAVEISDAQGDLYRVVRKVKADGRGRASSSLDVLVRDGGNTVWNPIGSGKIADGEAQIARILGGLTDDSLSAANFVLQREADRFTMRARREERRRLIAEAAGLGLYGELAERAQADAAVATHELALLQAKAEPLRARAAAIEGSRADLAAATRAEAEAAIAIAQTEQQVATAVADLERARARATNYDAIAAEATTIRDELGRIEADLETWTAKLVAAQRILTERARLEAAREALAGIRLEIEQIERRDREQRVVAAKRDAERIRALQQRADLERALADRRRERSADLAAARARLAAAQEETGRLPDCIESCTHAEGCGVVAAAQTAAERTLELETAVQRHGKPSLAEQDLEQRLTALTVPAASELVSYTAALATARSRAAELEREVAVADKIAAAEQVVREHGEATAKLNDRRAALRHQAEVKMSLLLGFGGHPASEVTRAQSAQAAAEALLADQRRHQRDAVALVASIQARLALYEEARAELAGVDTAIAAAAQAAADQAELVRAWRAVRVAILENGVIPAIEDTANEILRRFPYGLQIALRTQREKKGGDGTAEALDIEVLGGMGPLYEFCSGGQKTVLDLATHLALTLVVSRRASARLTFVFVDEPEGLDDVGRAAFAGVMNWVSEEFGLQVLVASHHEDLVGALGGRRVTFEGEPGNARVVAREAVPA